MSGLLKLLYPERRRRRVPDEDLEWAVRLALECRRRVKEQQKRIGSAEFRNTHFSYSDGRRTASSSSSPRRSCRARTASATTRCRPARSGSISPGGLDENPGLYPHRRQRGPRLRREDPQPAGAARPSGRACAAPSRTSTPGPRSWSATATRGPTSSRSSCAPSTPPRAGPRLGVGALLALCSALLEKSLKGGLIVVGGLNLGGSIEPIYNAVSIVEVAADKGAKMILMPVTTRKQLVELADDIATRVTVVFYSDARDALLKALIE